MPEFAIQLKSPAFSGDEINRDMNEMTVEVADGEPSPASHGGMNRMATHEITDQGILGVCWAAAYLVARIEVSKGHFDAAALKMSFKFLPKKMTDVLEFHIT